MARSPKLVLGAVLARCPRGSAGHTCAVFNWALSFRALGWDVFLVEHVSGSECEPPEAPGLRSPQEEFFHATAREFGFDGRACLLVDGAAPELDAFRAFAADAELFLNYSGQWKRLDLLAPRTVKAYLDVDPAFTQLWVETCGSDMNLDGHDVFLTVGTNLNGRDALVPRVGRSWITLPPPVPAEAWRARCPGPVDAPAAGAWSTIGHWYGYNDLVWQGRTYGGKRETLLALRELPRHVAPPVTMATDLERAWGDWDEFVAAGWRFESASRVCHDVPTYLGFIASSRGEIGIAKGGYVVSRGGWVSDRSLVYLSLGRPVLLQDTGWTAAIEPGPGLLPFRDARDCAARIAEVEADFARHAAGARAFAGDRFSPRRVLEPMLARILR